MNNRRALRTRKRLACSIQLEDRRWTGLVLDISATGLFIQTGAKLDPGARVTLELEAPGSTETLRIDARVVRRRSVPAQLKSVSQAGVGVQIGQAPEGYYAMVAALQDVVGPVEREKSAAPPPRRQTPHKKSSAPKSARRSKAPAAKTPLLRKLRRRYRVEVHEVGGKGARLVEVEALNVAAAARRALEEVGEGWTVVGCETA